MNRPEVSRPEPNLRIPGPTSLPPAVREAGGRQMINHRGPEFAAMLERIVAGLRPFFGTSNEIVLLTAAGTGGLEAAVVNTLSPGDRVLAVSIGAFGDRFAKIAAAYGAAVDRLEIEWGRAAEPDDLRRALASQPADGYRAILVTHNETSTGVINPLSELARVAREGAPDALLLVDGVSGVGAVPFEQDAWGLDLVVSGSQKSWMAAPGIALVSVGPRAWAAAETARMPRFYFDLAAHRKSAAAGQTPWTPAVAVLFQLDVALGLMAAEGPEAVFRRHAECAAATRAGLEALGFELFADPRHASPTVTAARVPDGLDWKAFNAVLRERGLVVAGGQGKLAGQVFRIGHLGDVTVDDIRSALAVLEEVSIAFGRPVEPGAALEAVERAVGEPVRA
ncbi:MAG TPA: alanine--glyoxylate aminotransferase family protein [Candidatus Limnocylindrales bacterium]|nr:alanine--glyoxylate aminotransferase family protein [Candidatus Limnocylindrales bacterium]